MKTSELFKRLLALYDTAHPMRLNGHIYMCNLISLEHFAVDERSYMKRLISEHLGGRNTYMSYLMRESKQHGDNGPIVSGEGAEAKFINALRKQWLEFSIKQYTLEGD